ncbi:MAG: divergent polysaccharide deacetylase family protein [Acetobacteraceae bacterium]|nr:divergent polysaccharide deacetylase family protein [Acetobacteraceae bacterium]
MARFWLLVLLVLGVSGGLLQYLGPPLPRVAAVPTPAASPTAPAVVATAQPLPPLVVQRRVGPAPNQPGRDQPGPVTDPDPALQEPGPAGKDDLLPRIAADGRQPMQAYAAGFDRSSRRPRIAVLVAGMGQAEVDSLHAVNALPGAVSFAITPYGGAVARVIAAARLAQHEYLVSIPMEPQGFPLNDPGNQALMTSLGRADNMVRLLWAMSRFGGYVGATGALGDLRGERFAGLSDQMEPVLRQIAQRGLLYVDPRPGQPPPAQVWSRVVDVVIDDPVNADAIDARLAELEGIARVYGSALGLAGAPRPVTVDRLAAWSATLADKGLVLAPVSAIVQAPLREPSPRDATPSDPAARDATTRETPPKDAKP